MVYASHALSPSDTALIATPTAAPRRPGLFTRFSRALLVSRQRQAERDIALYLTRTGGKFTDAVEREIEQRFLAR